METAGRVKRKETVKILTGKASAVEDLSGETERMWRKRYFKVELIAVGG